MPYVLLILTFGSRSVEIMALLDRGMGARVSVLPYEIGIQLGVGWEAQRL